MDEIKFNTPVFTEFLNTYVGACQCFADLSLSVSVFLANAKVVEDNSENQPSKDILDDSFHNVSLNLEKLDSVLDKVFSVGVRSKFKVSQMLIQSAD